MQYRLPARHICNADEIVRHETVGVDPSGDRKGSAGSKAVSYTHLDVYKRQLQYYSTYHLHFRYLRLVCDI